MNTKAKKIKNSVSKHYVTIAYGELMETYETHRFETEAELKAFLEGISVGCGWHNYQELERGEFKNLKEETEVLKRAKTLLNEFRESELGWEAIA